MSSFAVGHHVEQVFVVLLCVFAPLREPVFFPLQFPGLLPLGPLPQSTGLVTQDGQQWDAFGFDQLRHQPVHVERTVVAVHLADLHERPVLPGDVSQP